MADSFEIMKVWVPLTLNFSTNQPEENMAFSANYRDYMDKIYTDTMTPVDSEGTNSAWEKASELAKDGWELVGAIPIIGYSFPVMPVKGIYHPRDLSHSYTSGYELLFKRRIENTDQATNK